MHIIWILPRALFWRCSLVGAIFGNDFTMCRMNYACYRFSYRSIKQNTAILYLNIENREVYVNNIDIYLIDSVTRTGMLRKYHRCIMRGLNNAKIQSEERNESSHWIKSWVKRFEGNIVVFYWPISVFILISHLICKISMHVWLTSFIYYWYCLGAEYWNTEIGGCYFSKSL